MSCYHPLVGLNEGRLTVNGKPAYRIVSQAKDPLSAINDFPGSVLIPCGRCIGCRLDYSRSWADRMMLELETAGKGLFVTLTYDNDHLPISLSDDDGFPLAGTLCKDDVQRWMKRLRRAFSSTRIRFYLAGEYGETTFRPHYHAILFGIGLSDICDLRPFGKNELGQFYYISDSFARIWDNGFVLLSDVSWKTCAYVARYVTKKIGSFVLTRDYLNQLPEFALMSRKPGLGREYLALHPDCLDYQSINLSTPDGGLQIRLPKYFLNQLDNPGSEKYPNPLYDHEKYDKIKRQRKEFASDKQLLELSKTDLSFVDYLERKENEKLSRIKSLTRSSV